MGHYFLDIQYISYGFVIRLFVILLYKMQLINLNYKKKDRLKRFIKIKFAFVFISTTKLKNIQVQPKKNRPRITSLKLIRLFDNPA